jgi:hypothetical protein
VTPRKTTGRKMRRRENSSKEEEIINEIPSAH